ncbi:hypothetical protein ACOI1C_01985 [Bacillus sp. DJP31]|uniref:hypothetical protein n=1 Tax=Bacillus sp. DJP31 TaxID=3409789 RepID=UPI003BB68989
MEEDEVWKKIVKDEYGITVSKEEVDNFIKEGPDTEAHRPPREMVHPLVTINPYSKKQQSFRK